MQGRVGLEHRLQIFCVLDHAFNPYRLNLQKKVFGKAILKTRQKIRKKKHALIAYGFV